MGNKDEFYSAFSVRGGKDGETGGRRRGGGEGGHRGVINGNTEKREMHNRRAKMGHHRSHSKAIEGKL